MRVQGSVAIVCWSSCGDGEELVFGVDGAFVLCCLVQAGCEG